MTSRHVVEYNYKLDEDEEEIDDAALHSIRVTGHHQADDLTTEPLWWQVDMPSATQITVHGNDDVDLAILKTVQPFGKLNVEVSVAPAMLATGSWTANRYTPNQLATSAQLNTLQPVDPVRIAGYPAVGDISLNRPLLVSGIISSDPRYPATFGPVVEEHAIFCHSFSWGGMSGAPVLGFSGSLNNHGAIIGVNAGHIADQGISGGVISHLVRSDVILELLAEMGEQIPTEPDDDDDDDDGPSSGADEVTTS